MFSFLNAGMALLLAVAVLDSSPASTSTYLNKTVSTPVSRVPVITTVRMTQAPSRCGAGLAAFTPSETACENGVYIWEHVYSTATTNQTVAELILCNTYFTCVKGVIAPMTTKPISTTTSTLTVHVTSTTTSILTPSISLIANVSSTSECASNSVQKQPGRLTHSNVSTSEWSWSYKTPPYTATGWAKSDSVKVAGRDLDESKLMTGALPLETAPSANRASPIAALSLRDKPSQLIASTSTLTGSVVQLSSLIFPHLTSKRLNPTTKRIKPSSTGTVSKGRRVWWAQ